MMRKQSFGALVAAAGLLVLIIDSRLALEGAGAGVDLCIRTVIPSLFPFFVLTGVLTKFLQKSDARWIYVLAAALGISPGAAPALIPGFLGGYPVGAKCIGDMYAEKQISKKEAERMLAFCSNAGPSFLFGMVSVFFPNVKMVWFLWLIQISGAALTALAFPRSVDENTLPRKIGWEKERPDVVWSAIRAMGTVCGWIILFRTILTFLNAWLLWLFPAWVRVLVIGILELSNGCCELMQITDVKLRFIICACMLSQGGLCVFLQTMSVTKGLSLKGYFLGKTVQTVFCFLLSCAITAENGWIFADVLPVALVFLRNNKKWYGNRRIFPV